MSTAAAIERDDVAEDLLPARRVAGFPLPRRAPVSGVDNVEQPFAVGHPMGEREPVGGTEGSHTVGVPGRGEEIPVRVPVGCQVGPLQIGHPVLRVGHHLSAQRSEVTTCRHRGHEVTGHRACPHRGHRSPLGHANHHRPWTGHQFRMWGLMITLCSRAVHRLVYQHCNASCKASVCLLFVCSHRGRRGTDGVQSIRGL